MQRHPVPVAMKHHRIYVDRAPSVGLDRRALVLRDTAQRTPAASPQPQPPPPSPPSPASAATVLAAPTPRGSIDQISPDRSTVELQIQAIVNATPEPGETIRDAFQRKEQRLLGLFAGMTSIDASAMHRRLANPKPGDAIAERFSRFDVGRRDRLLMFLRDARRREAIAIARRTSRAAGSAR